MVKTNFNKETDNLIIKLVKKWEHHPKHYAKIHEVIPEYTSKQIRQRWKDKLNPKLCHDCLNEAEKKFVIRWVNNRKTPEIRWSELVSALQNKFGRLHSENKPKNFWYSEYRKSRSKNNVITQNDDKNEDISPLDILVQEAIKFNFFNE
ncbi:hypothetical protein C1645_836146 [Glomus cerebriforme]|uniref:HTH myb-type domain-containing protein n=1 Tax=Glomus cerebriforme TaxID=658196 RepID=A0A397SD61_9GLOM|nr:hypothetical protein C1645_836146 [Glomus cerebriforme]